MTIIDYIFIAFGLAVDAFAVSLASSTGSAKIDKRFTFRLAFHFGLFQGLMPIIGWFFGIQIEPVISGFDHWLAFILLLFVGGRMIINSMKEQEDALKTNPSKGMNLIMLSIATSIDALVVGFSFAFAQADIWVASSIIGIITASLCVAAIYLGRLLSLKFGKIMEIAGGIVLILIGLKIALSHQFGI